MHKSTQKTWLQNSGHKEEWTEAWLGGLGEGKRYEFELETQASPLLFPDPVVLLTLRLELTDVR